MFWWWIMSSITYFSFVHFTLHCTRDQSCLWDYHTNLTEKKCQSVWAVLSWNLPKKTLIQNPGQITQPSINLKVVLKKEISQRFQKSNLSSKSQLMKVWTILNFLGKFQLKTAQTRRPEGLEIIQSWLQGADLCF